MGSYDSEIQEFLYDTITGDVALMAQVDAVRLEGDVRTAPKFSSTIDAYIVIESLPRKGPTGNKNEFFQRAILHIYLKPEDRTRTDAILSRLSELFHNFTGGGPQSKDFETDSLVVFTMDGGVDGEEVIRGKKRIWFYVNLSYLKK